MQLVSFFIVSSMPPKKKAKTQSIQEREQGSNLVWSDDEIELLFHYINFIHSCVIRNLEFFIFGFVRLSVYTQILGR